MSTEPSLLTSVNTSDAEREAEEMLNEVDRRYRTAEAAAIIGIHPNTVRFYEELGLISKPEREENGYRIFTELHILQMQLIRRAFHTEILKNGLRAKITEVVRAAAAGEYDEAECILTEYTVMLHAERKNAEEAIETVRSMLPVRMTETGTEKTDNVKNTCLRTRKEAADCLGITVDTLRNWEKNGLLPERRLKKGRRVYSKEDICVLRIIKALRCADYSLEAILRMLGKVARNPDIDIREALNTPGQNEDIISVCDRLLASIDEAERNAEAISKLLQEMKMISKVTAGE